MESALLVIETQDLEVIIAFRSGLAIESHDEIRARAVHNHPGRKERGELLGLAAVDQ